MISNTIILNTTTDIITVPALKTYASVTLTFCNTSITDEVITVYAIPSGGTAVDGTTVISSLTIAAKETFVFDNKMIMSAGDKISAVGTVGSKVTATASYMAL